MAVDSARTGAILRRWLPLAVAVSAVCLLVYAALQQGYRSGLDDPQIQMAEDAARRLGSEPALPPAVVPATQVDIEKSLAPWVVVYDGKGAAMAGNGYYGSELARPPDGVFEATRRQGEDRVTWQPAPGVRQAIVVVFYRRYDRTGDGFVVAGRNMHEVEARIARLGILTLAAWIVTLLATLAAVWFVSRGSEDTADGPRPPTAEIG